MHLQDKKLEICCFSIESALNAQKGGADRIELCDNISEGGTTPSYGMIKKVREKLDIDVFVIIRPRGSDFNYSDDEFAIMKEDIKSAKLSGVNGIVSGILTKEGHVDIKRTSELVELSKPLPFTFHRAFDMTEDLFKALDDIIQTGSARILTSGGSRTASEGCDLISELVKRSKNKIIILPGSGINEQNITSIIKKTGAAEYHTTAKVLKSSSMTYIKENLIMGESKKSDYQQYVASVEKIKKIKAILENI